MKKSLFEDELISNMKYELSKTAQSQAIESLDKAVDDINSAIIIFEELGMVNQADNLLNILVKIAKGKNEFAGDKLYERLSKEKSPFDIFDDQNMDELIEEDMECGANCDNIPGSGEDLLAADYSEYDFEDEM